MNFLVNSSSRALMPRFLGAGSLAGRARPNYAQKYYATSGRSTQQATPKWLFSSPRILWHHEGLTVWLQIGYWLLLVWESPLHFICGQETMRQSPTQLFASAVPIRSTSKVLRVIKTLSLQPKSRIWARVLRDTTRFVIDSYSFLCLPSTQCQAASLKKRILIFPQPRAMGPPGGTGSMSSKQQGLSNADTMNPYVNEAGKSEKGEGETETAKVKGTVKTNRPQV